MKHTPGPWSVDLDGIERGADVNDSRGANVCNCFENDAHLIAAAPDLLSALQDVAQTLAWVTQGECRGFADGLLLPSDALDKAREVIAKAVQA